MGIVVDEGHAVAFTTELEAPGHATEASERVGKKFFWQLYEVSAFGVGQTVAITKVANQPTNYNNISPLYASDDRILFTTDRPRSGLAHLYPNLDEYESTLVVSGIWSLNPTILTLRHCCALRWFGTFLLRATAPRRIF